MMHRWVQDTPRGKLRISVAISDGQLGVKRQPFTQGFPPAVDVGLDLAEGNLQASCDFLVAEVLE
jgi:hypothetical protein